MIQKLMRGWFLQGVDGAPGPRGSPGEQVSVHASAGLIVNLWMRDVDEDCGRGL